MSGRLILGVDPGLEGALALLNVDTGSLITLDMPVAGKNVEPAALARFIGDARPDIAVVERVSSRPGQGVASSFKFGSGYGMVQGAVAALGIELRLVTPQTWKKHFRLSADKEQARALAIQLWPTADVFNRKKDAGRAEAALIARYAAETFSIRGSVPASSARGGAARPAGGDAVVGGEAAPTSSPRAPGVPA